MAINYLLNIWHCADSELLEHTISNKVWSALHLYVVHFLVRWVKIGLAQYMQCSSEESISLHEYALLGQEKASIKMLSQCWPAKYFGSEKRTKHCAAYKWCMKNCPRFTHTRLKKIHGNNVRLWFRLLAFSVLPSFAWAHKHEQSKMCVTELCSLPSVSSHLLTILTLYVQQLVHAIKLWASLTTYCRAEYQ